MLVGEHAHVRASLIEDAQVGALPMLESIAGPVAIATWLISVPVELRLVPENLVTSRLRVLAKMFSAPEFGLRLEDRERIVPRRDLVKDRRSRTRGRRPRR